MLSGAIFNSKPHIDNRTIAVREANTTRKLQTVRVKKVSAEKMMQTVSVSGKTEAYRMVEIKAETSVKLPLINMTIPAVRMGLSKLLNFFML